MDEIPSVRLIQISWLVVLAFTCSNVVVTISVALENAKGGFLGSALASGWASVSNLVYGIAGTKVALGGGSPLEVGIIIGQGIALAELYFTIMVLLFLQARDSEDDDVAVANDTAGSFALFNVIILAGFSVILYQWRSSLYIFKPLKSKSLPLHPELDSATHPKPNARFV